MDSDKTITANFTEIELCEVDYSTLHTGINTLTSHYQPMNIPFVDYAKQINAVSNIENINTYQLWHQHLNINGNNIPDQILVEVDHNTETNGVAHVFIDNEFAYSFGNESHAIRQLEIGDLDGNGTDDAVFVSTGIDREPFTGDPIVAVYLSTSGAEIDIVTEKRSYRHAGSLGDIDGDGDLDILAIDNLQFQNGNGMEEILWYENNGKGIWLEKKTNIPNILLQNTYQIELYDLNNDGIINYTNDNSNELYVDRDIMVLANPEIANLPNWVVALVAAGGLAAALSTAAGLLLVISASVSHDLIKRVYYPEISEKGELIAARISAFFAVCIAGYFGINPPGFVAAVVALAFGLAAASFFPAIVMGIFYKQMNKEGAIAGMLAGISLMILYMLKFKFNFFGGGSVDDYWFGISPEGFGSVAMIVNFIISYIVMKFTLPPPKKIKDIVDNIRIPEYE